MSYPTVSGTFFLFASRAVGLRGPFSCFCRTWFSSPPPCPAATPVFVAVKFPKDWHPAHTQVSTQRTVVGGQRLMDSGRKRPRRGCAAAAPIGAPRWAGRTISRPMLNRPFFTAVFRPFAPPLVRNLCDTRRQLPLGLRARRRLPRPFGRRHRQGTVRTFDVDLACDSWGANGDTATEEKWDTGPDLAAKCRQGRTVKREWLSRRPASANDRPRAPPGQSPLGT